MKLSPIEVKERLKLSPREAIEFQQYQTIVDNLVGYPWDVKTSELGSNERWLMSAFFNMYWRKRLHG